MIVAPTSNLEGASAFFVNLANVIQQFSVSLTNITNGVDELERSSPASMIATNRSTPRGPQRSPRTLTRANIQRFLGHRPTHSYLRQTSEELARRPRHQTQRRP